MTALFGTDRQTDRKGCIITNALTGGVGGERMITVSSSAAAAEAVTEELVVSTVVVVSAAAVVVVAVVVVTVAGDEVAVAVIRLSTLACSTLTRFFAAIQ